jgi:hypothetical protein
LCSRYGLSIFPSLLKIQAIFGLVPFSAENYLFNRKFSASGTIVALSCASVDFSTI